eukprot:7138026-Lingulodinium_polyedra.AAC.1
MPRQEIYVNNPVHAVKGLPAIQVRESVPALFCTAAAGYALSWHKSLRGGTIDWAGAAISVSARAATIRIFGGRLGDARA